MEPIFDKGVLLLLLLLLIMDHNLPIFNQLYIIQFSTFRVSGKIFHCLT